MKKYIRLIPLFLCAALLFSTVLAATGGANDPFGAFKDLTDDEGVKIKVKATRVYEPPYIVQLEYLEQYLSPEGSWDYLRNITIYGIKNAVGDDKISGSGWTFNVVDKSRKEEYGTAGMTLVAVRTAIVHSTMVGAANVTLQPGQGKSGDDEDKLSSEKKQEKRDKAKEKAKKLREMDENERAKELRKEYEKAVNPEVKTLATGTFTIPVVGYMEPDCQDPLFIHEDGEIWEPEIVGPSTKVYAGNFKMSVELTISESGYAEATVSFTNGIGQKETHKLTGSLTCVKDIKLKWSIEKDIPIWGTWTDKDIYAKVPEIIKNYNARQTALRAKETDPTVKVEEILYNNGKWLTLKKGKKITYVNDSQTIIDPKNEPYTYEMVEITDRAILYEKGEIWLAGDFELHPEVCYKFPRDHQDNMALYSQPLESYAQPLHIKSMALSYNFTTDKLTPRTGFFPAVKLSRVRGDIGFKTWTDKKGVEKPDPAKFRETPGLWYDFKLAKGAYVDGTDENGEKIKVYQPAEVGGFTFEKLTVNADGSAVSLMGRMEIYYQTPFKQKPGQFDILVCYVEKKTAYSADGKKTETVYGMDEDGEPIEDFDYEILYIDFKDFKEAKRGSGEISTIKLDNKDFYETTKAAINGSWCTYKPKGGDAPQFPDISKADARAAIKENYKDPVTWVKFDSSKREFSRLIWRPGHGLLLETGTYKTLDGDQVVLENIKGTKYDADLVLEWENAERQDGGDVLAYHDTQTADLYIEGIGRMFKVPSLKG